MEGCIMFKILFLASNMKVTMLKLAISKYFKLYSSKKMSPCHYVLYNYLRDIYVFILIYCIAS